MVLVNKPGRAKGLKGGRTIGELNEHTNKFTLIHFSGTQGQLSSIQGQFKE
jgi:hypothetical protein